MEGKIGLPYNPADLPLAEGSTLPLTTRDGTLRAAAFAAGVMLLPEFAHWRPAS